MIDSLGLLAAVTAVLAFPGGAFLLAATAAGGGLRHRDPISATVVAPVLAAVAACLAAALAPLPGSPGRVLPDDGGAVASLPAVGLLLGVAAGLCGGAGLGALRLAAAAALVLPGAALAAAASTPGLPGLAVLEGGRDGSIRVLAGVAAVLAVPLVVHGTRVGERGATAAGPHDDVHGAAAATARGLVVAAVAVCATAVALPARLQSAPAVLAAVVAAAVAAAAVGIGTRRRVRVAAAVAATPVAAAATLLVLVAR